MRSCWGEEKREEPKLRCWKGWTLVFIISPKHIPLGPITPNHNAGIKMEGEVKLRTQRLASLWERYTGPVHTAVSCLCTLLMCSRDFPSWGPISQVYSSTVVNQFSLSWWHGHLALGPHTPRRTVPPGYTAAQTLSAQQVSLRLSPAEVCSVFALCLTQEERDSTESTPSK